MRRVLRPAGILLLLLFVLAPFAEMVSMSLKGPKEQFTIPATLFPKNVTFQNFVEAWNQPNFPRYFINSLAITTSTTVLVTFISVFGAYGFTRLRFRGRGLFFFIILFSQMFCLAAIMVPLYRILANLGLIDTYPGLVIAYIGFNVPVGVWLLRSFLVSIPIEMEEAALVEGCTKLKAFVHVVLPLLRSGIGATAAYVFFVSWQEFLFALIFMTSQNHRTLPVGILDFVGQYETNWGNLMAASILVIIPVFVIFIFLQRQLIAGLTQGAVKG